MPVGVYPFFNWPWCAVREHFVIYLVPILLFCSTRTALCYQEFRVYSFNFSSIIFSHEEVGGVYEYTNEWREENEKK